MITTTIKTQLRAIIAAGLLLGTSYGANAATIFGAAHTDSGGASTLYSVDSSTGAATAIGTGLGFTGVSAMDFDPITGKLYGIGRTLGGGGDQTLFEVDTFSGIGTAVADIPDNHSFGNRYSGMSFRSDGSLFVYLEAGDGLGTLSLDGTLTELGFTGADCCGNGIGFDGSGVLYHGNDEEISTLSQTTGIATSVASADYSALPTQDDPRINSMDLDLMTGLMFASINDGSFGSGPNYLGTVDLTTGIVSYIGTSVAGLDALAVQNPPQIPVPAALPLFMSGLGIFGIMGWRRKRKAVAVAA